MTRKLIIFLLALGFACNASAAIIRLSDSDLLAFGDVGGTAASTLDLITDIPGDPGVQYDITWADQAGWVDIALGQYSPTGFGLGDTVEFEVVNLDPTYPTYARVYMQVDGWTYYQGAGAWVPAGGTAVVSLLNPAVTTTNSIGLKLGTDDWTGRPAGSSVSVQIIPEPATMLLLGLGGMFLRCKK